MKEEGEINIESQTFTTVCFSKLAVFGMYNIIYDFR